MDSNLAKALLLTALWIVVLIAVRIALRSAFDRYERRLAERDPSVAARRRTTFSFLLRVAIALIGLIGAWSVLSTFPATEKVASAFLASSAVLAVIAGLALTTPLGNLGSGVMLAFTLPRQTIPRMKPSLGGVGLISSAQNSSYGLLVSSAL